MSQKPVSTYCFRSRKTLWVDANTAIRKIQKGKRILIGSNCAEPQELVRALQEMRIYFMIMKLSTC